MTISAGPSKRPVSPSNTVFLDSLTFPSIFALVRTLGWRSLVNTRLLLLADICTVGRAIFCVLSALGLLRLRFERHSYFLGHLKKDGGEAVFPRILVDEVAQICRAVEHAELLRNPFLRNIEGILPWERLRIYYLKMIYQATISRVIHINIVERWKNVHSDGSPVLFFFRRDRWSRFLIEHGHRKDVVLVPYCSLCFSVPWREFRYALGGLLKGLQARISTRTILAACSFSKRKVDTGSQKAGCCTPPTPAVAVHCRDLDFDKGTRSDLIWWSPAVIPPSQLLAYFIRPDKRLTREKASLLHSKGISFTALGVAATGYPDAPAWKPGGTFGRIFYALSAKVTREYLRTIPLCGLASWRFLCDLFPLMHSYAFWYDFYRTHHVLVDVNYEEFSSRDYIGAQMALSDLGGVSIAYQCSNMSPFYAPLAIMPTADLMFSFSQLYQRLWAHLNPPVRQYINIGYLFDSVFKRHRETAANWRSRFSEQVDFVICFFDENPQERNKVNGDEGIVSTEEFVEDYRFLIEKLRKDETLGLLCKPKSPSLLRGRLSGIGGLVNEMERQRKLVFAGLDSSMSSTLPVQVGVAADVVIGGLIGTTAPLEAHLAGVPAVLIDTIGLHAHPFYCWGKNKVVFSSWESLFESLEIFRRDRNALPGFGNWYPAINGIDPFRDGNASGRMGEYIRVLHDSLKAGKTRGGAIEEASEQYRKRWGDGVIQHYPFQSNNTYST